MTIHSHTNNMYIYLENRTDNFVCPLWVLPVKDVFLVQLRILCFDCEGLLFKSFDSPKWSKLGVAIECPNMATNAAIFPTKFGCTHEILVFFQHDVEKTLSNILPQILILDGPQPRAPDLSGHCRTSARHQRECQIECQKECKNNGRQKECNVGQH